MNALSEVGVGMVILLGTIGVGAAAMLAKPIPKTGTDRSNSPLANWVRDHYKPVIAGAIAYGCYIAADFMALAAYPQFLRDHLFDGLAPAALVGILIDLFPREDPLRAFPKIKRPIMIILISYIAGAAVFALIAAAAIFSSGGDFAFPIPIIATVGGLPFAYNSLVYGATREDISWYPTWWFKKREFNTGADTEITKHADTTPPNN